jgi:uncharacterized membrane protein YcgQ (UPF0703/DUF1980 family)
MSNAVDTLFGPIDRKYCVWFYFLSIFGFVLLVIHLIGVIYVGLTKRLSAGYLAAMVSPTLIYAIFYFQNRLLFSMCSGAL